MTITPVEPAAPIGAVNVAPWEDEHGKHQFVASSCRVVRSSDLIASGPVPAILHVSALQNANGSLEDPCVRISMGTNDVWLPLGQARGVAEAIRPAIELLAQWEEKYETYWAPAK